MPLLCWYSYSFHEQIFNCFSNFATDFGNGNIMFESCPITKLNIKALIHVVTVMKTFHDQMNLYQAAMTPIMVMPGVLVDYTLSPWNSIQACKTKKDYENSSLADGASHSNSNQTSNIKEHHGDKCNPTAPDGSDEETSTHQMQKKPRCAEKVDTAVKKKTDLEMFYLRNISINPLDMFTRTCQIILCQFHLQGEGV